MAEVRIAMGSASEAMAEITRALGKMRFDNEGGCRVRTTYEMAVEKNMAKAVGSFIVEIGDDVTKAELVKEVAAGSFTREIGVTKPGAAGSFTGEIGFTNAELGNKEVAGSSAGEIGVTKAALGNDKPVGIFAGQIGATKATLGNKEAADNVISDIGITTKTAASGIKLPAQSEKPREEPKFVKVARLLTKERVPEWNIERMKRRPLKKIPLSSKFLNDYADEPNVLARFQANLAEMNYLVDVEEDCLRQHAEKGYAEIGVDYNTGVRRVFILAQGK